ncbi:methylamine utilization protein MauJ [Bosea sp. LjRoot237]|uniref:methylamine utilization protein MauJ n=1 Tax=Bosea sp. LjRoot237 TaxID=3342292 RepID=UPI003ECEF738
MSSLFSELFPRAGSFALLTPSEVFSGELAEPGEWVVASVEAPHSWSYVRQQVEYRGHTVWILPYMLNHCPGVAMRRLPGLSPADCEHLLVRFLSALSWAENKGFVVAAIVQTSRPQTLWKNESSGISPHAGFSLQYLPEPQEQDALLALAFMREARGLNHPAYAFLSFFRVVELLVGRGEKRKTWFDQTIPQLSEVRALAAVKAHTEAGRDIGDHLFRARRGAIAHASPESTFDPDDPSQLRDVESDLPIISALAVLAIESILGIETSETVYRRHLYELSHFKKLFGPELVEIIASDRPYEGDDHVELPIVDVRLKDMDAYAPLLQMVPTGLERTGAKIAVWYRSQSSVTRLRFILNFPDERLEFDPLSDVFYTDNGSAEAAREIAIVNVFQVHLAGNGVLQIFDSESGQLLARKSAYIPQNWSIDSNVAMSQVQHWRDLAEDRSDPDGGLRRALDRWAARYTVMLNRR